MTTENELPEILIAVGNPAIGEACEVAFAPPRVALGFVATRQPLELSMPDFDIQHTRVEAPTLARVGLELERDHQGRLYLLHSGRTLDAVLPNQAPGVVLGPFCVVFCPGAFVSPVGVRFRSGFGLLVVPGVDLTVRFRLARWGETSETVHDSAADRQAELFLWLDDVGEAVRYESVDWMARLLDTSRDLAASEGGTLAFRASLDALRTALSAAAPVPVEPADELCAAIRTREPWLADTMNAWLDSREDGLGVAGAIGLALRHDVPPSTRDFVRALVSGSPVAAEAPAVERTWVDGLSDAQLILIEDAALESVDVWAAELRGAIDAGNTRNIVLGLEHRDVLEGVRVLLGWRDRNRLTESLARADAVVRPGISTAELPESEHLLHATTADPDCWWRQDSDFE